MVHADHVLNGRGGHASRPRSRSRPGCGRRWSWGRCPGPGSFMEPSWPSSRTGFALLHSLVNEGHGVAHIGRDRSRACCSRSWQRAPLGPAGACGTGAQTAHSSARQACLSCSCRRSSSNRSHDLDADLGVLVGVEGGDAALGGAEGTCRPGAPPHRRPGGHGRASAAGPARRR